jgi:hypothetical protein
VTGRLLYLAVVLLTMLVLPAGSVIADQLAHPETRLIVVIGRWFVFWGVGVRLGLAGLRQIVQPAFTARQIFHIAGDGALTVVRELGVANIGAAVVGLASLVAPSFVLPAAISAAIFYGVAGAQHVMQRRRSFNETLAMASDLFMFLVLAGFAAATLSGGRP